MDNLILLKNFSSIPEAELAKQLLNSERIKSMIQKGNIGVASEFTGSVGDANLFVVKRDVEKAKKILKISNEDKNNPEHFVNIGSYRAEEADILKSEFEKNGIPVKVFYP